MRDVNEDEALTALTEFVARELLDGEDIGLDASTPLLEYGLIDSLSLVSLTEFVAERFGVVIPAKEQTPQNLKNLASISALVARLGASR